MTLADCSLFHFWTYFQIFSLLCTAAVMVVIADSSYILAISREIINCCHAKLLLVLKINMSTRNLLLVLYGGWWTLCTKTHFTPREHFTFQKRNTLCSPTHLAKSQFTLQHTLLLNTLCLSEPFCFMEPFATQHILLPGTLCSSALFTP